MVVGAGGGGQYVGVVVCFVGAVAFFVGGGAAPSTIHFLTNICMKYTHTSGRDARVRCPFLWVAIDT